MNQKQRVLFLGQYPLDKLNTAPKIRTYYLWQALAEKADVTFITGTRASRRLPLLRLILQGGFKQFDCVYLEAATSTSMEIDLLLLFLLKWAGIPLGIFIRDAYPLFGFSRLTNPKQWLLYWGWFISQWCYRQCATVLFFPTQSLASYFSYTRAEILPPAARLGYLAQGTEQPLRYILYAGFLNDENGWPLLQQVMDKIYTTEPHIRLLLLTASHIENTHPWMEIRRGTLEEIRSDLPAIACAVIPRLLTEYNHLSMPIKLMDYLSLGLPVVVTACREMSALVQREGLGLVCSDQPEDIANKILQLFKDDALRRDIQAHIKEAVLQRHNWSVRAEQILNTLLSHSQAPGR